MVKNDILEVEITDIGVGGEGIGKVDGLPLFIKDAVIGDVVRAKVMKMKKNYGYARMMEIIKPSTWRVEPRCEFHRQCGGCQIQAMDYERQLVYKHEKVLGNLRRIGGFDDELLRQISEPAVGMEEPWNYRNKAQFPIGTDKEGNPVTGFYAARTHSIIPNRNCLLGVSVNEQILDIVLAFMKRCQIPAYDETTGKGLVRHVLIRYGFTTKEIMVCLIINGNGLPHQADLISELCQLEGMTSVSLNFNTKQTNVILGEETQTIWGKSYITDYIHLRTGKDFSVTDTAVAYQISPQSFYQVNPVQTEKLYSTALEYAQLTGTETVWDLYCGIGTISLFLAQKAKQVYGVEIVPQAIEDARRNAKLNQIQNAEFFVGKSEEVLPEFYEKERMAGRKAYADVVVVDPPRKGCEEALLDTIVKMQPPRVVYVSCDSATLARDLKYLCGNGYELKRVRVFDQFCHTVHVEVVTCLHRVNS